MRTDENRPKGLAEGLGIVRIPKAFQGKSTRDFTKWINKQHQKGVNLDTKLATMEKGGKKTE